jgi:excinuclease UvrABC nuclease subunit|tara:strand:+ start:749 stop:1147 length:399 start_codon:yes stop_codon:yes gene_type:complete
MIKDSIEFAIDKRLRRENITPKALDLYESWKDSFKGHKRKRGVYVIFDNDNVIYVGKGFFTARNTSHYNKAINKAKYNPKGWIWLKENYNYSIDNWQLYMIELDSEVDITFMEGALIKDFMPLANDEVYNDR